jgi:hypothetical protein
MTQLKVMKRKFLSSGPETRIVKKIMIAVREKYPHGYLRKIHGNAFQHAGIPDIVGCIQGHFVGLEVKTTSGRVSKIQELEGLEIVEAKGIYGVVTDAEEALQTIKEGLRRIQ